MGAIDLTGEPASRLNFGEFALDLRRVELTRGGVAVALRPKTFALLLYFARHPGQVLGKHELLSALWPGVVVSDDSLSQCVNELRSVLHDREQTVIKTISRRGYRFDAVVSATANGPYPADSTGDGLASISSSPPSDVAAHAAEAGVGASPPPYAAPAPSSGRRVGIGTLAVLVAVAALAAVIAPRTSAVTSSLDEAYAARRVIAVMPFMATGEDAGLRETADRLADEIADQMVTYPSARAIGRIKTAAFNAAGPDLERLASALHATYLVTGRVTRAVGGAGATLDVTLLTVPQGDTVGSAHFDMGAPPLEPSAAEIGQLVVSFFRGQSMQVELQRATAPGHVPDAADLTLLGWHEVMRISGREDIVRAQERFRAALRQDPDSARALTGLVAAYVTGQSMGMPLTPDETAEFARSVDRMMKFAPEDPNSAALWADLQLQKGRPDLALPAMEKALRLTPNFANGHLMLGQALLRVGRVDEAKAELERAARLASLGRDDRRTSTANMVLAEIAIAKGDDKRAADLARRAIAIRPSGYGSGRPYAVLAAAEALLGQTADAASEMAVARARGPAVTVTSFDAPRPSTHPAFLAQRARLYEGLQKAGMPKG